MEKGVSNVVQNGVDGVERTTYKVTYTDDIETDREVVSVEVTKEPINEITEIGTMPSLEEQLAYAIAEKMYATQGFGSAEEFIETMGGVNAFMEESLRFESIELYNFDNEILKEYFRIKNEHVGEVHFIYIYEPIDNLDLVVEEVLKLDKDITVFKYDYLDKTRNEPVYPTLTPEQQQRLGEKFPSLIV